MSNIAHTPTKEFDLQAAAYVMIDACRELTAIMQKPGKKGVALRGWDIRIRNRLTKEAGCGYNEAYYMVADLRMAAKGA